MGSSRLRDLRQRRLLSQEELAHQAGVSTMSIRRWETGRERPQPLHLRRLCAALEATPAELGLAPAGPWELLEDDLPEVTELEAAVLRLRRSYSTMAPAELLQRIDERRDQFRRLLVSEHRPSRRHALLGAVAWLLLLRANVLPDLRRWEAAESAVLTARRLAQEIGHAEVEAWSWEISAWMTATSGRQREAVELAGEGIRVAPWRSHGLVAVTLQRGRIHGALGDERAAVADLLAGEKALDAAPEVTHLDDHFQIDRPKAAYFASGAMVALHRPRETIELAEDVIIHSSEPRERNYWPMRVANARLEWAGALAELGEEDGAVALAVAALDRQWFRPDTEQRTRAVLARMRDRRLREQLAAELEERLGDGRG
jgi:transcriptional regulator with XRE-family HTH domain